MASQPKDTATTPGGGKAMPAVPVLQRQSDEKDENPLVQMMASPERRHTRFQPGGAPMQLVDDSRGAAPGIDRFNPIQKKANDTGLPDNLKSGVENLSGISMDDVKVHYNSDKPSQLQAHAYAQGADIHLAPGQEQHLPHEAWHVVQQKQGRVKPTLQMKAGVPVNDDKGLESEADTMGAKALQAKSTNTVPSLQGSMPGGPVVVQAKGFRLVNEQKPAELEEGSSEATIAQAGSEVWESVFTDETIDGKGGVIATYTNSDKKIDAEAKTIHEEEIPEKAFASVTVNGDLGKSVSIDRWSLKEVNSEDSGELIFEPGRIKGEEEQVKSAILRALEGGEPGANAQPSDIDLENVDDFMMMMKPILIWCAENTGRKGEVVDLVYKYLLEKMIEREGHFTNSLCETITGDEEDGFPAILYETLVDSFNLAGKPELKIAPTRMPLSIGEVIMHEFGHIHAALITSKENIEITKKGFKPDLGSAVKLADFLLQMLNEGPPQRELLGQLRFAWAGNVTDWYKIRDHQTNRDLHEATTDALKIMANILMSIEEYMNIMDIDNKKVIGSKEGMRLRHGTEVVAGMSLGVDVRPMESGLANRSEVKEAHPQAMADKVWRDKLCILLNTFLSKYQI